jgi:hypothetical protein
MSQEMIHSPEEFDGTLRELYAEFIEPNLPQPAIVEHYHHLLLDYAAGTDPLFVVRMVSDTNRRIIYRTSAGTRFVASDNAPVWWMHHILFNGALMDAGQFAAALAAAPAHIFDVRPAMPWSLNDYGWHAAYIFDVKDRHADYLAWTREEVVRRFLRNIHPCNCFLIPKTGWREYSGNPTLKAFVQEEYAARYASIWPEFVDAAREDGDRPGSMRYKYAPERAMAAAAGAGAVAGVSYSASRLLFRKADIEPLAWDEEFQVNTPLGSFRMTKREFYEEFQAVAESESYRKAGCYHYSTLPAKALAYRVR